MNGKECERGNCEDVIGLNKDRGCLVPAPSGTRKPIHRSKLHFHPASVNSGAGELLGAEMRVVRALAAALAVVMVAACATSATNTLSQAKREALRIDEIELVFAPDATISWIDALNEF